MVFNTGAALLDAIVLSVVSMVRLPYHTGGAQCAERVRVHTVSGAAQAAEG